MLILDQPKIADVEQPRRTRVVPRARGGDRPPVECDAKCDALGADAVPRGECPHGLRRYGNATSPGHCDAHGDPPAGCAAHSVIGAFERHELPACRMKQHWHAVSPSD
jgi:hypothetical protein